MRESRYRDEILLRPLDVICPEILTFVKALLPVTLHGAEIWQVLLREVTHQPLQVLRRCR